MLETFYLLTKMALMGTLTGLAGTLMLIITVDAIKRWKKGGCKCQNKLLIKVEDQERK